MTILPDKITALSIGDLVSALAHGYRKSLGSDPVSPAQLACLGAQLCLESGNGQKAHCWNFGNRKARDDDPFTCTFRCDEIFDAATTKAAQRLGPCDVHPWHDAEDGTARFRVVLPAGHLWAMFAAFETAEDGCRDYCDLLSANDRFALAWSRAYAGDAAGFSHGLRVGRYYTADEATYTRGLASIAAHLAGPCAAILNGLPHGITEETAAQVAQLVALTLDEARRAGDTEPSPPPESEPVPLETV